MTAEGCKLLLDAFQFVGINRSNIIPKSEIYTSPDETKVKYNLYIYSGD
jgi:hypothetical protein